jgi:transketolase
MTALAVGLALEGKTVFTYSIANFPTLRCLEQIRNDVCLHQANVKIVAVGGGFAYGPLGVSHHATEDLAVMRAMPHLTVLSPADTYEVAALTRLVHRTPGACYLRLGRGGEGPLHASPPEVRLGRAIPIFAGEGVALLVTGSILRSALAARELLERAGLRIGVFSVPCLKPFDDNLVRQIAKTVQLVVTVEEHSITGGLGSAVAEILSDLPGARARLRRVGLANGFSSVVGDQEYLRATYGMSPEGIADAVRAGLCMAEMEAPRR